MATASVTNQFGGGANAVPADVNTNFSDLVSFLNGSVVHKDGSVAMTGALVLPGSPTTSLQATTKGYVDDKSFTNTQSTTLLNNLPVAAGSAVIQIQLADPGYDLEAYGVSYFLGQPDTALDLTNMWAAQAYTNGVLIGQLNVPVVQTNQSFGVPIRRHVATTGAGTGTAGAHVFQINMIRVGGSQAKLTLSTDPVLLALDVFYRKKP